MPKMGINCGSLQLQPNVVETEVARMDNLQLDRRLKMSQHLHPMS
jgi:hypothetical protein